jgi:hypothetical protein
MGVKSNWERKFLSALLTKKQIVLSGHQVFFFSVRKSEIRTALLSSKDLVWLCFISNRISTTLSKGSAENSDGNALLTIAILLLCRLFKLRYICLLLMERLLLIFLAVSGPLMARWTYTSASVRERPKLTSASIIRSKLNHFHFLYIKIEIREFVCKF